MDLVPARFSACSTRSFSFRRARCTRPKRFQSGSRWFPVADPFTYIVHALRNLTVKATGIEGIYVDVLVLLGSSALTIAGSIALFKRQL